MSLGIISLFAGFTGTGYELRYFAGHPGFLSAALPAESRRSTPPPLALAAPQKKENRTRKWRPSR
jgi:hypothetical protein